MKASESDALSHGGLHLHVRRWGRRGAPKLFMLHGWMDVSASFQFVVDALAGDWEVLAPDARGFGLSSWPVAERGGGHYWFPEYLADLDSLLDAYSPDTPVNLLGHSMGANVACLYAGVRPERVRRVVDLEGFGLAPESAHAAPALFPYPSLDAVAARLVKTNPRLSRERAHFLAQHWSQRAPDGNYRILGDPAHKRPSPFPYHPDEVLAIWRRARAPVLHVEGSDSETLDCLAGEVPRAQFKQRFAVFADWREALVADAGHMLHHDQPERVAALIEGFCV